MKQNGNIERRNNGTLRDQAHRDEDERLERLREEVRRYEQDLRELADA